MSTMRSFFSDFKNFDRANVPLFDFHMHTTWTDGADTAGEMHAQAINLGLKHILFSEHVRSTSGDWFMQYVDQVRALPAEVCRAFVGIETKVADFDGNLDCTAEMIATCDFVMASIHRFPGEKGIVKEFADVVANEAVATEYRMASAVLDNPHVDILGHPFGMCYRRFQQRPPEKLMRALIEKAAAKGVAFEVNSHYHPDPWTLIKWCHEAGALISLGSNAHMLAEVGKITRILQGKEPSWTPSGF